MQNQFSDESKQFATARKPIEHESSVNHVSGGAEYVDDIVEPLGTLHVAPGWCGEAVHAEIKSVDYKDVILAPGVVSVITSNDIPGLNDCSPSIGGDPLLESELIQYFGQVVFAVVAETREDARRAARKARFELIPKTPTLTIADAIECYSTVLPDYSLSRNWPSAKLHSGENLLSGQINIGGQEHFYLEGQVALAIPNEDGGVLIYSSTQHPTEVQHIAAKVLAMGQKDVTVECRRMGGGFGGKESQATQWAVLAALCAKLTRRPCKVRLDRDDDMIITGKRHDFKASWEVSSDQAGKINSVEMTLDSRCGHSADLSLGVNDRALFHADSAYFYPSVRINSRRMRTNTCSNTAFRGFGGPQGILAAEHMLDSIAANLGMDPLEVRKHNLYRENFNVTHFDMEVEEYETLNMIFAALEEKSEYWSRREKIRLFNSTNQIIKKGIALTPVKFGISFTLTHLNQAAALINLYTDGTIQLNHGGTEMGQGLHTKILQIVAEELGVDMDRIRVKATSTGKVPNTSPTAASASTDLNGMASRNAAVEIRSRLAEFAAERYQTPVEKIRFAKNSVTVGHRNIPFEELVQEAHKARVQLSATGFYATPGINWDSELKTGKPFHYFTFGAACSEVSIDTLTGELMVDRVDIIHDVGKSINSALDIGQIEGAFIQGMGWVTSEELVWDKSGQLLSHSPSTYKIPTVTDLPNHFNVELWKSQGNPADTIYNSKAVGEPPLMHGISVFSAIFDALTSLKAGHIPKLNSPATPEAIMKAVNEIKSAGT